MNKYYKKKYGEYLPLNVGGELPNRIWEKGEIIQSISNMIVLYVIQMDLNINSPACYTNIYGIDDGVYWMCRELSNLVKDRKYSNIIDIVGVVPIVAPKDDIDKGLWKEEIKCDLRFRVATVSLRISFDEYIQSDVEKKKSLIIDNVLKSVKAISKKGEIDFDRFKEDVDSFCERIGVMYL